MPMIQIKTKDAPAIGLDSPIVKAGWYQTRYYNVYVLFLLVLAYQFSQMDRYLVSVVIMPMAQDIQFGDKGCLKNSSVPGSSSRLCSPHSVERCLEIKNSDNVTLCRWDYNGHGWSYLLLVGPMFILVYTFGGIFLGMVADQLNRKLVLAMCIVFWSLMTLLTGLVEDYWQLVILRFCLALGESGCTPFSSSLISDYFSRSNRGTAMGVYHFGVYFGYSLSYAVGNGITLANINGQGWRWAFILLGIPGIALGLLVALTIVEPDRARTVKKSSVGGDVDKAGEVEESSSDDGLLSLTSSYDLSMESVTELEPREELEPDTSHASHDPSSIVEPQRHMLVSMLRRKSSSPQLHHRDDLEVLKREGSSTDMLHGRHRRRSSTTHQSVTDRLHRLLRLGSHTDIALKHTSNTSFKARTSSLVKLFVEGSSADPVPEKPIQKPQLPFQRSSEPKVPAIKKPRARGVLLMRAFQMPAFTLLCLAGSIRNAAGYTLAYYTQLYFEASHVPREEIARYLSWVPLLGGSVGALSGGFISDRVVKKKKLHARVFVIAVSQFLATPFAICVLSFDAPLSFFSFLPALVFGEMWISVAITVAVELVPSEIRTSVVAMYLFVITNLGGNFPLIVPSITYTFEHFGYNHLDSLRGSLYIMYPGFFFLSGMIFLLTMFVVKWKEASKVTSPATPTEETKINMPDGTDETMPENTNND